MSVRKPQTNYEIAYSAWLATKLTEQEKAQRLRALRPSLDALRNSYQTDSVQSRTRKHPEAYLLGYVLRTFTKPRRFSGAPFRC